MPQADALLERIEAFPRTARGEVVVRKVARDYSLFSARTRASIARRRPTGEADKVRVLWWTGVKTERNLPRKKAGVAPAGWTGSGHRFDTLAGVLLLELHRAAIAERGM